ncbi:MAG: transaldolase family protein [Synechococcaceae cyanobacterium]|nr:transaldolase family protein [Synechococcaceae cyanobacterium]
MSLRLLLDSAELNAWQAWLPTGLFHGLTTNPTLLRRAGVPCRIEALDALTSQARRLGCRELHLQAWGASAAELIACGQRLAGLDRERVVVKLPLHHDGAAAARALIEAGVPVTLTACYDPPQVLVAAALGASYIAPYLGRISDLGRDGHAELQTMQRCLDGIGSGTRLLVASLRTPADLSRLAAAGVSSFTIAPAIAAALLEHPATLAAAAQFERDAGADPPEAPGGNRS